MSGKIFNDDIRSQNIPAIVDNILNKAVESNASDIHFEPTSAGMVIKFRLDGSLTVVDRLGGDLAEKIVARLKVLAGLLTYRNDIPQEGRIEPGPRHSEKIFDQRLATFPTIYGQRAVVRLFLQDESLGDLEQLGFAEDLLENIKDIARRQRGVLLFTGPAGSGKSTTLAALLRYIGKNWPGRSIITLEDPVEIRIDRATQVQINSMGEFDFARALRSLVRQDPEVLMIGEIRDAETAGMVIQAGLTGHLLLSTMHSGSPAGALLRLLEMGIEPYQITSGIAGVVNQRLVRRLCPDCRQRGEDGYYISAGCEKCFNTGCRGRVLIAEMAMMEGSLRKGILGGCDAEQLAELLKEQGAMTLRQQGMRLVCEGVCSMEELNRVCI